MILTSDFFRRFPKEAEIIGLIVASYGEIEHEVASCLAAAMNDIVSAARMFFRVNGEERRILVADAYMRPKYQTAGLYHDYCEAIAAAQWCRRLRNQYAHCQWHVPNRPDQPIQFVDLEASAKDNDPAMLITARTITLEILKWQQEHFMYTDYYLTYLHNEYDRRAGKSTSHGLSKPTTVHRPPLYSGHRLQVNQPPPTAPQPSDPAPQGEAGIPGPLAKS